VSKITHVAEGQPINEWFLDEIQEFLSTMVSANFVVSILNPTTLRIAAGTGNDQVSVGIAKADASVMAWRWITANVDAAAPGTLVVGDNDVFVTAYAPSFAAPPTPPPREIDTSTSLGFALVVLPPGSTPAGTGATALYRKVARATWDGVQFTAVKQIVGAPGVSNTQIASAIHLVGTLAARPVAAAANAGFLYWATDVLGGTLYESTGSSWTGLVSRLARGADLLIAAGVLAPVVSTHRVSGSGTINTITPPANVYGGWVLTLESLGTTTITGAGNVVPNSGLAPITLDGGDTVSLVWNDLASTWHVLGVSPQRVAQMALLAGTAGARPTAAAVNAGFWYYATDTGLLSRSTGGGGWVAVQPTPFAHAASHGAGAVDALPWTTIHGIGTFGARPTAGAANAGYIYLATDLNAGTLFRSDGATWAQMARSVNGADAGGTLASAPSITATSSFHSVSGSTTIDTIGHALPKQGQELVLYFNAPICVRHNVGNILLSGGLPAGFVAGEMLTLMWDGGSHWVEKTRTALDLSGKSIEYNVVTSPAGYLVEDGSAPLISTAPALGLILGTTHGGNGTTTFGLPDSRGRTTVAVGTHGDVSALGTAFVEGSPPGSRRPRHGHPHGLTIPNHLHSIFIHTFTYVNSIDVGSTNVTFTTVGGQDHGGTSFDNSVDTQLLSYEGTLPAIPGTVGQPSASSPSDSAAYIVKAKYIRV
jgi:microcystin-dependent protein